MPYCHEKFRFSIINTNVFNQKAKDVIRHIIKNSMLKNLKRKKLFTNADNILSFTTSIVENNHFSRITRKGLNAKIK